MKRRTFLTGVGVVGILGPACGPRGSKKGVRVNDIHSQLNETFVHSVKRPTGAAEVVPVLQDARRRGLPVSIAGGRHAMGGQQFLSEGVLLDTRALDQVISFDPEAGLVTVGAGLQWPELIAWLAKNQKGNDKTWSIRQKQTGADRLCIGGAVGANVHGRGLAMKPFVDDIEALEIVDGTGTLHRCSRVENNELFTLAIGGYGLFGVVTTVTVRLAPRRKLERVVEERRIEGIHEDFEKRIQDGFLYGDFQFSTNERAQHFLKEGVYSCYRPVPDDTPLTKGRRELSGKDWTNLLYFGHVDKKRAYDLYVGYYKTTSGQVYWSDTHQLGFYSDDYHRDLDRRMVADRKATEVISELYVPRDQLADFMSSCAADFRKHDTNLIYGTVRLIERDDVTFLPWAKDRYACIVVNLHTEHSRAGMQKSADAFRRLIDRALERGGNFFLTYHRHATKEQVLAGYPRFPEFLAKKQEYDPDGMFQSDWYRHYRKLFDES